MIIMVQVFVDREFELESLEREFKKEGSSFAIIYGRRRVGKTAIVEKFIEGKYGIYYLAEREGSQRNMKAFQREVERMGIDEFSKFRFDSWTDLFSSLCRLKKDEKMVIVIDEFPNLVERGVLVDFQKSWDLYLSKCNVFLILVGSSISMMEKLTLNYSSPLYGRRTMQLRVNKLKFWDAWKFMPAYSLVNFVKIYSITDGIPYYLLQMNPKMNVESNIKRNVLSRDRVLYEEAEFLLRIELREFRNYFPILKAIASGKRSFNEIMHSADMSAASLSKYLKNLQEIGIIVEDNPLFGQKKMRRYKIADNYFSFWFGFVYPNRNRLELGLIDEVWREERNRFDTYVGHVFEDIALDIFRHAYPDYTVGRWWNRKGDEIDLVAYNTKKKEVILGEVKFGRKIRKKDLDNLKRKEEMVNIPKDFKIRYLLVAPEIAGGIEDEDTLLWDFKVLEKMMRV